MKIGNVLDSGCGVCNVLDRGNGVGNGLDREHVDVVVDVVNMPACDVLAFQVLLLMAAPRWNTTSDIEQHSSSGTRTSKCYHGHDQVVTGQ